MLKILIAVDGSELSLDGVHHALTLVRQGLQAAGAGEVWEFGGGSGALAEQLLDLHRMEEDGPKETLNLARVAKRVAADLAPLLKRVDILKEARGWNQPSDHVPVTATFDI